MSKRIMALLGVLMAAMMLLGACATPETDEEATAGASPDTKSTVVVAEVNGEKIYYDEYYAMYKNLCSQYGVSEDDATYGSYLKNLVINSMVEEEVLRQKLTEEGYMELTPEQLAEVEETAQADLDSYVELYYKSTIESELGENYTDEEYEVAKSKYIDQLLEQMGTTEQEFKDYYVFNIAREAAREDKVGSIVPTDAEVKAKYDEYVAADQTKMDENPSVYEANESRGITSYYIPQGVRMVRQVLIGIDQETTEAISLLRADSFNEQADFLLEKALADIKAKADDVLNKIKNGQLTFEQAIEQFNDDPGMTKGSKGYPVTEGSTSYVESFTNGSMSLAAIGDFTELIASDYGYHIIEYFSDLTPGPVALETVKETIYNELLISLQDEAWKAIVEEWTAASNIQQYPENL